MYQVQLIDAQELAKILKVSTRTLWRLLAKGELPEPIYVGRSTRWRLDSIHQWIGEGCPPLTARNN